MISSKSNPEHQWEIDEKDIMVDTISYDKEYEDYDI
jgi:hypothetical protein